MKKINLISLILFLILFHSCKKNNYDLPTLITTPVNDITLISAVCGANITDDGGTTITTSGICWSTDTLPTTDDDVATSRSGQTVFTCKITGLTPNKTYYVRAYAINSGGTAYGNVKSFKTCDVSDGNGNYYHTVTIGTQVWMVENLKATNYRNGDPIPNVRDNNDWMNITSDAFCDYDNDTSNAKIYGHLYNWYAVTDSRNIAPFGWHIASNEEWTELSDFLGGASIAGGELKETGTSH